MAQSLSTTDLGTLAQGGFYWIPADIQRGGVRALGAPESRGHSMLLVHPQFVSEPWCAAMVAAFKQAANSTTALDGIRQLPQRTEIAARTIKSIIAPDDDSLDRARQDALSRLAQHYGVEGDLYIDFTLFSQMREGDRHILHADNEYEDANGRWVPNHTEWRDFTALLYLNSSGSDYQEGHLLFPRIGEEITPEAGLFVAFPSNHQYLHEVTPVVAGERYTLSIWTTRDPEQAELWE